jgi:hypothetical protein
MMSASGRIPSVIGNFLGSLIARPGPRRLTMGFPRGKAEGAGRMSPPSREAREILERDKDSRVRVISRLRLAFFLHPQDS